MLVFNLTDWEGLIVCRSEKSAGGNGSPAPAVVAPKPKCGNDMPISATEGCPVEHWKEVLVIVKEVILGAGFEPNLVSDADDIGVIQKRIIQNVYNNEIILCDVSGRNPNVMFELGMRLAFDKPTIIIKDDKTDFAFDTQVIEHVGYPRDLRYPRMIDFRSKLEAKIKASYRGQRMIRHTLRS